MVDPWPMTGGAGVRPGWRISWAMLLSLLLHGALVLGLALAMMERPKPPQRPIRIEFLRQRQSPDTPPPEEAQALAERSQRGRVEERSGEENPATTPASVVPPAAPHAPAPVAEAPTRGEVLPGGVVTPMTSRVVIDPPERVMVSPTPPQRTRRTQQAAPEPEPVLQDVPLRLTPTLGELARWDRQRQEERRRERAEGGEATVDINTRELRFVSYFKGVKQRVEQSWVYPLQAKRSNWAGRLLMVFTVDQDGRLVEIEVVRSSGYPVLDEAAMAAVRKSAPFAPLPESWNIKRLRVKATFEYIMRRFQWGG